ncbi:hypothetical protein G7046_g7016 [Stylonectria norvegica]|nr:hypothetical protein G7046_g7016 [Stylonectria norvegica]
MMGKPRASTEHGALVKTIKETLRVAATSVAYVFFTSYRPWKKELDEKFFDIARSAGFEVEQIAERRLEKPLFDNDPGDLEIQKTVRGFAVRWPKSVCGGVEEVDALHVPLQAANPPPGDNTMPSLKGDGLRSHVACAHPQPSTPVYLRRRSHDPSMLRCAPQCARWQMPHDRTVRLSSPHHRGPSDRNHDDEATLAHDFPGFQAQFILAN